MKLVRYGAPGAEKPGMIDEEGVLRDLSAHVDDLSGAALGDATVEKLRGLDPTGLTAVDGNPRLGCLRRRLLKMRAPIGKGVKALVTQH